MGLPFLREQQTTGPFSFGCESWTQAVTFVLRLRVLCLLGGAAGSQETTHHRPLFFWLCILDSGCECCFCLVVERSFSGNVQLHSLFERAQASEAAVAVVVHPADTVLLWDFTVALEGVKLTKGFWLLLAHRRHLTPRVLSPLRATEEENWAGEVQGRVVGGVQGRTGGHQELPVSGRVSRAKGSQQERGRIGGQQELQVSGGASRAKGDPKERGRRDRESAERRKGESTVVKSASGGEWGALQRARGDTTPWSLELVLPGDPRPPCAAGSWMLGGSQAGGEDLCLSDSEVKTLRYHCCDFDTSLLLLPSWLLRSGCAPVIVAVRISMCSCHFDPA